MITPRTQSTRDALEQLQRIVGEYAWWVRTSADGVLRLDFGAPHLAVGPIVPSVGADGKVEDGSSRRIVTPTGRWHFFVEDGSWTVTASGLSLDRPSGEVSHPALTGLSGQKLTRVEYSEAAETWTLSFDLGGSLKIMRSPSGDAEWASEIEWTLFFEDGNYLSMTNDSCLKRKSDFN